MFNIIYNEDISIEDLIKLKNSGMSILRSAHIGNFNKQTNFLAELGFHIILHEHLKGNATIYNPSYLISDSKKSNYPKIMMKFLSFMIMDFRIMINLLSHLNFTIQI